MAEETEKMAATPIPDEDWHMAFSGPAPVINRMFANNTASGVRIAFAEQFGEVVRPVFRSAITLSYEDATALRGLLDKQLAGVQFVEMEIGADGKPVPKAG